MKIDGLEDDSFPVNMVPFQETHVYLPGTSGTNYQTYQPSPSNISDHPVAFARLKQAVTLSLPCVMARLLATRRLHSFFQPLGPECSNHIHSRKLPENSNPDIMI